MANKFILFVLFLLCCTNSIIAQITKEDPLYKTILSQDSLLFSIGFNRCNVDVMKEVIDTDFKFYHDRDGISDKSKFIADFQNGICNATVNRKVKRLLVAESTAIFPLYKDGILYGAIQNGEHTFTEEHERTPGIAKFSNVGQLNEGVWKLINSLSFDHKSYESKPTKLSFFDTKVEIGKWLQDNHVPMLGLGLISNGVLQQVKVYGENKKGVTAPYNTIFNVASLTKPVTAMVALKLVSLGKLSLDEPLSNYWVAPAIAHDSGHTKLTTRWVLSHQTGFPNWRWMAENEKLHFEFEPGTQYQYSGEGMEYLRNALESKFGKSLQMLANELIFEPLKMTSTNYIWDPAFDSSRIAIGYDAHGTPYELVKNTTPNAADDLWTTLEDYGKFLVSVLNGEGLTQSIQEEMMRKQVETSKGKHFGLGFEIYTLANNELVLAHGGADKGVRTMVFLFPETKEGLIIYTNSDTGVNLYGELLITYLGDKGRQIVEIETQ